jgi:NADH:ubiquinone oxidoreductase subunit
MTLGTQLFTLLNGELVGTDTGGNRYYTDRGKRDGKRKRRWVVYKGRAEASSVPAEWHGWLHGRDGASPPTGEDVRRPWQADHQENLTGTLAAYRPPGDVLGAGKRDRATGDYQPWKPS